MSTAAAAVVAAVLVCATTGFVAYHQGANAERAQADIRELKLRRDHGKKIMALQDAARKVEDASETRVQTIIKMHLEERENDKAKADSIVAAYRSDNLRLQRRFAAVTVAATGPAEATPGLAGNNATETIGLQGADVEFLVRFADDADQVANALRACQGVVLEYQGLYRSTWPDASKAVLSGNK